MTASRTNEDVYSGPTVTTDAVVLRIADDQLQLLIHRRPRPPYEGKRALPGLYVGQGETIAMATDRCLATKAGLALPQLSMRRIINVYDSLDRDPRGHSLSVVSVSVLPTGAPLAICDGALWVDARSTTTLAFDHVDIVASSLAWVEQHLWTDADVLRAFVGSMAMTTSTLLHIARVVDGVDIDASNLRRKLSTSGIVEPTTARVAHGGPGRPSVLWRWRSANS
jgi:ADP-ribose pyrophosphatase YjhB (NUDIX family)